MTKRTMKDPQIINGCQIRCFIESQYDHTCMHMHHIAVGLNITM